MQVVCDLPDELLFLSQAEEKLLTRGHGVSIGLLDGKYIQLNSISMFIIINLRRKAVHHELAKVAAVFNQLEGGLVRPADIAESSAHIQRTFGIFQGTFGILQGNFGIPREQPKSSSEPPPLGTSSAAIASTFSGEWEHLLRYVCYLAAPRDTLLCFIRASTYWPYAYGVHKGGFACYRCK
jgi:hypothetical protein